MRKREIEHRLQLADSDNDLSFFFLLFFFWVGRQSVLLRSLLFYYAIVILPFSDVSGSS